MRAVLKSGKVITGNIAKTLSRIGIARPECNNETTGEDNTPVVDQDKKLVVKKGRKPKSE